MKVFQVVIQVCIIHIKSLNLFYERRNVSLIQLRDNYIEHSIIIK
jgi:hypothetical protein